MIKKVTCPSCNKGLFNVSFNPDDTSGKTNIFSRTKCVFCHDSAFEFTVGGRISIGPISKDESNYPTVIANTRFISNNKFEIIVKAI